MHGISAHSALAIKRQRKKKEAAARRPRRQSSNPSLAAYLASERTQGRIRANKVIGTVTMFHIGTIFTLIGILLGLAALLTKQTPSEMAELIGTGIICLVIGVFLLVLNWIYGRKEEEDLENYVESCLAKTKDGSRLVVEEV